MKKLLITGSSGFIGHNLKEYMLSRGYDVYAPTHGELDLLDVDALGTYLKSHTFDVVIHAANTNMADSTGYEILNNNLRMFFNLEKYSGEYGKLLYFGSGAEYGRMFMPEFVSETYFGTVIPEDSYGFTKYLMRKMVDKSDNIFELCIFAVYGKYEQWERRFISNNMVRSLKGLPMTINRNCMFDYLYIDDLCRIVEWFVENDPKYRHYNVCTSSPVDLLALAHGINDISGFNREIIVREEGWNAEYSGNNGLLLAEMGKFEFTDIKTAMRDLWGYYQLNIHEFDESKLLW